MKIVTLIASATEIVCALGLEKQLVGRSHECDYPEWVLKLPSCTETKFVTSGSSAEIDTRIKEIVKQGTSVYRVFEDRLKDLQPDLIVTQIQCEVCAVSEKDVKEALCSWLGSRPKIVSLNPGCLSDIWKDIERVADAAGVNDSGQKLIARLQARIETVKNQALQLSTRPSVACIEWIEPLMSAGNWMPELIALAGGENLFGVAGKHSPYMSWDDLVAKDPEIILITPCGWDVVRTRQEMHFLTQRSQWSSLRAVKNGKVFLADGNQYFNRPGPRIVESLEILAELIHPEAFHFGFQGRGWERYRNA